MKKEVKYIWVVETENIRSNGEKGGKNQSFFSTEEKAQLHFDWCCACADNNDAILLKEDEVMNETEYKLSNGEHWTIKIKRKVLDIDDLFVGEC